MVEFIQEQLKGEFCCCGYKNTHSCLKESGYQINHKKVYRLMKEHKLLYGSKLGKPTGARTFVKYRRIEASRPYECLCMDIKYIIVHGDRRNALLLTVLDVHSRKTLGQTLQYNILKEGDLMLLSLIILEYRINGFTIRNDNGSQFIASMVRKYLIEKRIVQEFNHVSRPEENS